MSSKILQRKERNRVAAHLSRVRRQQQHDDVVEQLRVAHETIVVLQQRLLVLESESVWKYVSVPTEPGFIGADCVEPAA